MHSLGCRRPKQTAEIRPVAGEIKSRLLAATHTQTYITSVRLKHLINTFTRLLQLLIHDNPPVFYFIF
jgi:hypothetical protein